MQPIRILLASHQPIVRSGLRLFLERQPGFQVVAEAANGREAIVLTEFTHPNVALLEIELPQINGIAVAKRLASQEGSARPLFVTTHTDKGYAIEAFKAGARGFVSADSATADLPRAIRVVNGGRFFLSPAICSQFLDSPSNQDATSERARELLCLLAAGYDETEIAALWSSDPETVREDCRSFKAAAFRKLLPDAIAQGVFAQERYGNS
jgi:DNA-binding NarL/FixJ family response regulator